MIGRDPIIDMQTCTEADFMAWLNGYAERFPEIAAWGVARSSQMRQLRNVFSCLVRPAT